MLDAAHVMAGFLGGSPLGDTQIFVHAHNTDNALSYSIWNKPRGVSNCFMWVIGSGGGGGGGHTAASATARGGGGGGGGGTQCKVYSPTFFMPDKLFIRVGRGGTGGAASTSGTTGISTIVSISTDFTSNCDVIFVAPGGVLGTGGGAGGGGGAGSGGGAATNNYWQGSNASIISGTSGSGGGSNTGAVGVAVTLATTGSLIMGGTGGGGVTTTDFAGGLINVSAGVTLSDWRTQPSGTGANSDGSGGVIVYRPFWVYPGMGGGTSNLGQAGKGGNGIMGSGGGGGGGGTTGGSGGAGGDGAVLLFCS